MQRSNLERLLDITLPWIWTTLSSRKTWGVHLLLQENMKYLHHHKGLHSMPMILNIESDWFSVLFYCPWYIIDLNFQTQTMSNIHVCIHSCNKYFFIFLVMRLTKPSLMLNHPVLCSENDLPGSSLNEQHINDLATLKDTPQFGLSELLTLPQNFGSVSMTNWIIL